MLEIVSTGEAQVYSNSAPYTSIDLPHLSRLTVRSRWVTDTKLPFLLRMLGHSPLIHLTVGNLSDGCFDDEFWDEMAEVLVDKSFFPLLEEVAIEYGDAAAEELELTRFESRIVWLREVLREGGVQLTVGK